MTALDRLLPTPRILEVDHVDVALSPERAWELVRHGDLGQYSSLVRALFAVRTIPSRVTGHDEGPVSLRIDELASTADSPGFQVLLEHRGSEVVVGAIGKVWHLDIPFVHVASADEFAAFSSPDFAKIGWAIRVLPLCEHEARIEIEVRVDTTDEPSWRKFRRYFRVIGPFSRFIRRSVLAGIAREEGTAPAKENERVLAGDDLLVHASAQVTRMIDIRATPSTIWPWLVQMGGHRAGFYAIDALDNANVASARELHPELLPLAIGDVLPATRNGGEGFEVLRVEPNEALILGGLFDTTTKTQLPFGAARPKHFWCVTWSFVLERRDSFTTRLHARARVAHSSGEALHAAWIRPIHALMQTVQLRNLALRAEGRLARDGWRDVASGASGAAIMLAAMLTPFMRRARRHWGLDEETAMRTLPGDELIPVPTWDWTHGIEIDAGADDVWKWVAQIGADRGGFYSYQWLENLVGCGVRNAERVHPELAISATSALSIHPKMPPLPIAVFERGSHFVAYAAADEAARAANAPWLSTSWGFYVEPLPNGRSRFISRFRCASSNDALSRIQFGPPLLEPIGFAMDRRMLLGVKARVEAERHALTAAHAI
ncbi:hypothetical protein BH09MYX1_BH09MYX1_52120 [soil metagenome]